eukprot:3082765-Amphidinium_carterae.1
MQPSAVRTVRQPTNEGTFAQIVVPDSHGPPPQNVRRPAHATHSQPRGYAVPQLIGEYRLLVDLPCHETIPVGAKRRTLIKHPKVPLGSKMMAINTGDGFRQYAEGVRCSSCGSQAMQAGPRGCMGKLTRYGVYHTPDEWHSVALTLKFPMDQMPYARPWQVRTMK